MSEVYSHEQKLVFAADEAAAGTHNDRELQCELSHEIAPSCTHSRMTTVKFAVLLLNFALQWALVLDYRQIFEDILLRLGLVYVTSNRI